MRFANAPISYGVYGDITVDGATTTEAVLQSMATAGYDGSELGPPGLFGTPEQARTSFRRAGLSAAGAYVPLHTQEDLAKLDHDLAQMELTFDEICAVDPDAIVILADEGNDRLLSAPRKSPALSLDGAGWARLAAAVSTAAARARDRGLEVSFHPHISTYVELPDEIERLLELTDVSLTFDVGHIVLAGGDGVALFRAWRERINHVHIKDVRRAVFEDFRAEPVGGFNDWWPAVCAPLGHGDSDLDAFAEAIRVSGYDRWIVVEQDRAPLTAESVARVFADQAANLLWLHQRFRLPL